MTLTYNLVIDRNKVHLLNISTDAERATHSYKRLLYLASSFRAQEPSVKVEVDVLRSSFLIVRTVSVDSKQH